jgi:hypothetical protein
MWMESDVHLLKACPPLGGRAPIVPALPDGQQCCGPRARRGIGLVAEWNHWLVPGGCFAAKMTGVALGATRFTYRQGRRRRMSTITFLTKEELEAGLPALRQAPKDEGELKLIVRRPDVDRREVVTEATLDLVEGLVGDSWRRRQSSRTPDGSPHPDMQLNVISTRLMALIAPDESRWQWAGDQLFLDLDLSKANLPVGARLALGSAVIEVTAQPHTGCKKFVERFGVEAMKLVNSAIGRELQLRGINARVVQPGVIRVGDRARKL